MATTLERIAVSGFKSIREMDLKLESLNVLIGANGAGKSNFIGVFRLMNEILERRLQVYSAQVGANSLLYFGPRVTGQLVIDLSFGEYNYSATLVPSSNDRLIFANEAFTSNSQVNGSAHAINSSSGHDETVLYDHEQMRSHQPVVDNIVRAMKAWKVSHFHDTSPEARVKQTHNINDNAFFRPDGANLAAFLYLLQERHTPYYERIVRSVRLVAPFFDTFFLRPSPLTLNHDKIRLEWREHGTDGYSNAHRFSDGTLRFICLTTLLLQPEPPSLILIDEPELGLHPYAINLLAGMIRSASVNTQVIISTQSVTLLNQFTPEDVIVVDREDGQSVFKRLSANELADWLQEYSLGELWEMNVISGRPKAEEPNP